MPARPSRRCQIPGEGRAGFEPVTSSVSVQGSYLGGSRDHDVGGSGRKLGEPLCGVVAVISAVTVPQSSLGCELSPPSLDFQA
jgi:hypothetical protein